MKCHECVEQLSALLDGEISTDDRVRIEQHLAKCPTCTQIQLELRDVDKRLRMELEPAVRRSVNRVTMLVGQQLESLNDRLRNRQVHLERRLQWLASIAAAIAVGYFIGATAHRTPSINLAHVVDDGKTESPDAMATIGLVTGPVEVALPDTTTFLTCTTDAKLDVGMKMRTGPNRKCELETENGAMIRLDGDTEVYFSNQNEVVLQKGRVWCCETSRDQPSSSVTVRSNGAAIRVSGASCDVRNVDSGTEVLALSGDVQVVGSNWQHDVPAGQKVAFAKNGPVQSVGISNPVLETRWLHELLLRKDDATEELSVRVHRLLADVGYSKMQNLLEEEIRALGPRCVDPLVAFLQSEVPKHQPRRRRLSAAMIIRDLAEFRSAPDLVPLLSDDDASIRYYIAVALRRLFGRDIVATPDQWRDGTREERSVWTAEVRQWMEVNREWFHCKEM